jgi:hypothetical protein
VDQPGLDCQEHGVSRDSVYRHAHALSRLDKRRNANLPEQASRASALRKNAPSAPQSCFGPPLRIRNGSFAYKKSFGYASLELGVPLTLGSVFYVASVSKQFTAASVVLAAEPGYLSLDDDVRKYIPELQFVQRAGHWDEHWRQRARSTPGILPTLFVRGTVDVGSCITGAGFSRVASAASTRGCSRIPRRPNDLRRTESAGMHAGCPRYPFLGRQSLLDR